MAERPRNGTVLVLDGNSGPALEIVRSLGRAGWRVIAAAGSRSGSSCFTARAVELPESFEPAALADAVADVLAEEPVDLLAPCSDASAQVLWEHHERFGRVSVLGGDRRSFELAVDKAATLRAAESAAFPVPRWCAPEDVGEARRFASAIELPLVVKPRRSFVARAGRLIQRRHRFVRALDELEDVRRDLAEPDGRLPVLQEYVRGRSLAVTAVVRDRRVLVLVARETLSFEPLAGGTSVWKRTIAPDEPGVAEAGRLLSDVGFEGLAEVEYQVGADGLPRLMEIGARSHGWLGLAIAANVDVPLLAAAAVLGDEVPPTTAYRVGVEMRWPGGELSRLRAALGPRAQLPPDVSRLNVIARAWPPWRPGMRYDGVDRSDLVPLLPTFVRLRLDDGRRARRRGGLRPAPSLAYPLKAGMTRTRSVAWLARSRRVSGVQPGLRLLFYHRISDDRDELAVLPKRFREQMALLAGEGYRVIDVVEAVDLLRAQALVQPTIGLSFDDAFRDVAEEALPVLEELGFRATVFVPTGIVDGKASFEWYSEQPPVLGWDEICELERAGTLRFEAHSVTHANLLTLTDERAEAEIAGSKVELEDRLGRPVEAFCYPAGLFGARERRLALEAGFRMAVSCEPGLNRPDTDSFLLHRQQVDARDRLLEFRAKLNGGLDSPLPGRTLYRKLRYGAGTGNPWTASSRA
jgi:peptidoglycan/xylan/chitin deacetylase (PgdA/CDA1 family)/predicted ATP-grasp superfamily ATP-dependent carboligase